MGRGRAKAKQTKVARDLKYRTHETDFASLAKELHGEDSAESDDTEDRSSDTVDPADTVDDYGTWSEYAPRD